MPSALDLLKENWIGLIILLSLVFFMFFPNVVSSSFMGIGFAVEEGQDVCPFSVLGSGNTTVKYFTRPNCPACWKQELVLKSLVLDYGDSFSLEKYDTRFCEEKIEYNIRGTPSFVIHGEKYTGFISYDRLVSLIKESE